MDISNVASANTSRVSRRWHALARSLWLAIVVECGQVHVESLRNFINVLQWRAEGHIDDAECAMLTEVYVKKSGRGEFVGEREAGEDDEGFSLSPSRKRRSPKRSPGRGSGGSSSFSPRKNKVVSLKVRDR